MLGKWLIVITVTVLLHVTGPVLKELGEGIGHRCFAVNIVQLVTFCTKYRRTSTVKSKVGQNYNATSKTCSQLRPLKLADDIRALQERLTNL
jgi:hypothetical protein